MQEAPLSVGRGARCRRVVRPDSLPMAAAEHVRWRPRNTQPDQLLSAERRVVLSENIVLRYETPSDPAPSAPPRGSTPCYHLAMEAAPRPGRYSTVHSLNTDRKVVPVGRNLHHRSKRISSLHCILHAKGMHVQRFST